MKHHTPHHRPTWRALAALAASTSLFALADRAEAAEPDAVSTASEAVAAYDRWQQTGQIDDYVEFISARDQTASTVAGDHGIDQQQLVLEWAGADDEKQQVVLAAISQLGVPYQSMASEPGVAFDCSGLTIWAYANADIEIPRVSNDQIRASEAVAHEDAEAGDLVGYPGHVGIYLGADHYVHAPYTGVNVRVSDLPDRKLNFGNLVDSDAD